MTTPAPSPGSASPEEVLGALYRAERVERQRLDLIIEMALAQSDPARARAVLATAVRDYDPSNPPPGRGQADASGD